MMCAAWFGSFSLGKRKRDDDDGRGDRARNIPTDYNPFFLRPPNNEPLTTRAHAHRSRQDLWSKQNSQSTPPSTQTSPFSARDAHDVGSVLDNSYSYPQPSPNSGSSATDDNGNQMDIGSSQTDSDSANFPVSQVFDTSHGGVFQGPSTDRVSPEAMGFPPPAHVAPAVHDSRDVSKKMKALDGAVVEGKQNKAGSDSTDVSSPGPSQFTSFCWSWA